EITVVVGGLRRGWRAASAGAWRRRRATCRRRTERWTGTRGDRRLEILEAGTTELCRVAFGRAGLAEVLDDIKLGLRRGNALDQTVASDALVGLEELALLVDLAGEHFL